MLSLGSPDRRAAGTNRNDARDRLRMVIADDEPLARDCLRVALAGYDDVEIVAECADGTAAVDAIESLRPDIVLLDVQMPGLDGFGVIERVGVTNMPTTVFVTAFDAHALRAFQVHALDYILKPFDDDRLRDAMTHARAQIRVQRDGARARQLAALLDAWQQRDGDAADQIDTAPLSPLDHGDAPASAAKDAGYINHVTVREGERIRFVACADVDWFEADGNYVLVCSNQRKHRVRLPIRSLIDRLDPALFVRIHRSVIVNITRIREVQPWFGGDYIAILHDGTTKLRVARSRAAELLRPTR